MDKELVILLYEDKIKKLLDKLLEPNFEIKTDTYLNLLLSYLSGKDDKDLGDTLMSLPIFTEWLHKCLQFWEEGNTLQSPNIIAFVFQVASLLLKDETRFITLDGYNVYKRLAFAAKSEAAAFTPLVQLGYIRLLTSFVQHKKGIECLIANNDWMEILEFCLTGQTVFIIREGHNFMFQLLVANSHDEVFCNSVVAKIMLVFKQIQLPNNLAVLEVKGETIQENLMMPLKLIGFILETHLKSDLYIKQEYNVPLIFVRNIDTEQTLLNSLIAQIKNKDLVHELGKVLILHQFYKTAIECEPFLYDEIENRKMIIFILGLIKLLIEKNDTLNILRLGFLSQYYWGCITQRSERLLKNRDIAPLIFDQQVIIFQVFPILAISYTYCDFNMEAATETGSFRDEFISKIFSGWCQFTIRGIYQFRKRLEEDHEKVFENAQRALMYIMKSRPSLPREPAILAYRFFIYILKDMTRVMTEKPQKIDIFMKNTGYIMSHLDAIHVFMQEYDITWRESIETISIMRILMKFVHLASWPHRLFVHILKLVNLCIARFATPNLALLIDNTTDTSMSSLGPILVEKLYDNNWEVRDSSLEVLYTICTISHTKFPSFQTLILELEIPPLIVTMGLNDSESFVRASALKCLSEMVRLTEVWVTVLKDLELTEKMLQVLYNETEAIVRCEAVAVVCAICEYRLAECPLTDIDGIHQAMLYSATQDLHWEVKLKALNYWDKVISNRLTHQGMIDGAFPEVTFSSEKKKIVILTNEEIKNRLEKLLAELSECGCLGVLVLSVLDDCDIEVSKKAVEITNNLSKLLTMYNLTSNNDPQVCSQKNVSISDDLTTPLVPDYSKSEVVIDEIVNTRDINLLPYVFVDGGDSFLNKKVPIDHNSKITPHDFLKFIKKDLDIAITQRKNWLNNMDNLGSLLDDMLKNYDINDDMNVMDCY